MELQSFLLAKRMGTSVYMWTFVCFICRLSEMCICYHVSRIYLIINFDGLSQPPVTTKLQIVSDPTVHSSLIDWLALVVPHADLD